MIAYSYVNDKFIFLKMALLFIVKTYYAFLFPSIISWDMLVAFCFLVLSFSVTEE